MLARMIGKQFRCFHEADDSTATSFDQSFETYSPANVRKML